MRPAEKHNSIGVGVGRTGFRGMVPLLSVLVVLAVFWNLKLTGITLAGEAFCGNAEHVHEESCYAEETPCTLEEHIHDATCYSDLSADLETASQWEDTLMSVILGAEPAENIVQVAQSQLGYQESERNFQVDASGVRRGYTRYGEWYGNPYGDWSAMFVSFCLHYAGVEDVPVSGGAETMRLSWEEQGLYRTAETSAAAFGELVFLDRDENGAADGVGIITGIGGETIRVIEGDLENAVSETEYDALSPALLGYGILPVPETQTVGSVEEGVIAYTTEYTQDLFTSWGSFLLYRTDESGSYAVDGNGQSVPISIDESGNIRADVADEKMLLWSITPTEGEGIYLIQNLRTEFYLMDQNSEGSLVVEEPMECMLSITESGVELISQMPMLLAAVDEGGTNPDQYLQVAAAASCTVWFDGTNGGLMSLGGSPDRKQTVTQGSVLTLPEEWESPAKYSYVLRGWYDVINSKYYAPGAKVTVQKDMVFYADWAASTYDIGQYNAYVADTVSTNSFITTRVFDYGVLFNVLSEKASVTVNANSHSETWSLLTSGKNSYNGQTTLNYIFRDWDAVNDISYPSGHNNQNNPTNGGVYAGLYTDTLKDLLFNPNTSFDPATGTGVIGKNYLGTADHLFQIMDDENDAHYGYYYYDSERNAATYNQSDGRFYVYNNLECTRTSSTQSDEGKYCDFLPLNSPYVNTNGKIANTYSYAGLNGEYTGVTNYMYDDRYNDSNNDPKYVGTNFWFGMSIEIQFYLPNVPGQKTGNEYGNQDLYGRDMHFKFSGDDDVWIFVSNEVNGKVVDTLVLDLGGIHGIEGGDINFATGDVTVDGKVVSNVRNLTAGDHKLTVYYLERGASMSNCLLYFNLAPRFSLSIQKEDVLTRDVLNGAEFSVYTDAACKNGAQLWESKEAHDSGAGSTYTFTVKNGVANMWGFGSGNTYYIKETSPPADSQYSFANGIIELTIDNQGIADYSVRVRDDGQNTVSPGFTVHGFRIDEEAQTAYLVATNAPKWVEETTAVRVRKEWADNKDHSGETVTVYLTVLQEDGTYLRLQEAQLGKENDWIHRWENLPKYYEDGEPVVYGVEEAYISGYYPIVGPDELTVVTGQGWIPTTTIEAGKTYLFKTDSGYLASAGTGSGDKNLRWMKESDAKNSNLAKWKAEWVSEYSCYLFVNGNNQYLTSHKDNHKFYARQGSAANQCMNVSVSDGKLRIFAPQGTTNYYFKSLSGTTQAAYTTVEAEAQLFTVLVWGDIVETVETDDILYKITNTPLEAETSLTVSKGWDLGHSGKVSDYEQAQVKVKLLADGVDTGRTVILNLRNNWRDTFRGLPYQDSDGKVIKYTVQEVWGNFDWIPVYGEISIDSGNTPTYSTTITNVYRWGVGEILPSTGTFARLGYILCGGGLMLASLVYGIDLRRRRERGRDQKRT